MPGSVHFQLRGESDEETDAAETNFFALLCFGFSCALDSVLFVDLLTTHIPSLYVTVTVLYFTLIKSHTALLSHL